MSEVKELIMQRDEILNKIITECEENQVNLDYLQKLYLEHAHLNVQINDMQIKLNKVQVELDQLSTSNNSINKILKAIEKQRWYFFENKSKVIMDKKTGFLWADLAYFPWQKCTKPDGPRPYYLKETNEIKDLVKSFDGGGVNNWKLPSYDIFKEMIIDKTFPYQKGEYYSIRQKKFWFCAEDNIISLENLNWYSSGNAYIIPYSDYLVTHKKYTNIGSSETTLNLFIENSLIPIFEDKEITQLYKKIYVKSSMYLEQLYEAQTNLEHAQAKTSKLFSLTFDYIALLEKYNIQEIDNSIIKYYQGIQQWTTELMNKLDEYSLEKESVIKDFNQITLNLSKKYKNNTYLTEQENNLFAERQTYFQKNFSLDLHKVKSKILAVKKQANSLEYRLDEIDNGDNAIQALALLKKEERASFETIAENTAKLIKNALHKIEYFQENRQFIIDSIDCLHKWTENYYAFKTVYRDKLKTICEADDVEEEIWSEWYHDWQDLRFTIEQKVQPIIAYGLKSPMKTLTESKTSPLVLLLEALEDYKNKVDQFFLEERKGIHQKFVFQYGGELQEKFEAESELYKLTTSLHMAIQEIMFNCVHSEDRIFILEWADSLLDIHINEILDFVSDNNLNSISKTILTEFATLKQKNYEVYLTDAKAYSEEKARREKEYNSLIYKMRKDLMKQKTA